MMSFSWQRGETSRLVRFLQGTVLAVGLAACSPDPKPADVAKPAPPKESAPAVPPEIAAQAASLYGQSCAMCHFDGKDSASAPPLVGSAMMESDPRAVIRVVLHGSNNQSVVGGKTFGGIMPGTSGLTDAEVAAVINYARTTFCGVESAVTPAEVAAQR